MYVVFVCVCVVSVCVFVYSTKFMHGTNNGMGISVKIYGHKD